MGLHHLPGQDILLFPAEPSLCERNQILSERLSALEATSDLCWITTHDGRCLAEQASSWERFTGQRPAQAVGKGWLEAVHPGDREPLLMIQTQCVLTKQPRNFFVAETQEHLRAARRVSVQLGNFGHRRFARKKRVRPEGARPPRPVTRRRSRRHARRGRRPTGRH